VTTDGLVLVLLEEPGPGRRLIELPDDGLHQELLVLDGQGQQAPQHIQLAIDGPVCGAHAPALCRVGGAIVWPDAHQAPGAEVGVQVLQAPRSLRLISLTRIYLDRRRSALLESLTRITDTPRVHGPRTRAVCP